jgi:hypothetical protein
MVTTDTGHKQLLFDGGVDIVATIRNDSDYEGWRGSCSPLTFFACSAELLRRVRHGTVLTASPFRT